ncbi:MAG: AraC family transcriptional regulator [bacterium]
MMSKSIEEVIDLEIIPRLEKGSLRVLSHNLESKIEPSLKRPKSHYPESFHSCIEFCFVLEGECVIWIERIPIVGKKGSLYIILPGEKHFESYISPHQDYKDMWIIPKGNDVRMHIFGYSFKNKYTVFGGLDVKQNREANKIVTRLIGEIEAKHKHRNVMIHAYLAEFFTSIFRDMTSKSYSVKKQRYSSWKRKVVDEAISFMQGKLDNPLTLIEIAQHVYLSPNYFSSLFHTKTKRTVFECLSNLRIEKARALLRDTNMKIGKIAEKVGYQSPYYFSYAFKKSEGISPFSYRKSH